MAARITASSSAFMVRRASTSSGLSGSSSSSRVASYHSTERGLMCRMVMFRYPFPLPW
jgi:hypothetical protein